MIFKETQIITADICDTDNQLSIWGVARLFQDVASHHTDLFHIGFDDMIKNNQLWVLSKMFYDVKSMPRVGDSIIINTWSRGIDGLQCKRDFMMQDSQGNTCVTATSSWVVIDATSRRLVRVDSVLNDFEHHADKVTPYDRLPRIKVSKDVFGNYVKLVSINESMIDRNQHMNNSEYLRIIFDEMEQEPNYTKPQEYSVFVEYLMETLLNDSIEIYKHSSDDSSTMYQLCNSKGTAINAEVKIIR